MERMSALGLILAIAMLPTLAAAAAADDKAKTEAAPSGSHSEWVMSVAFSPDGTQILSGGFDATAKVWDADTGKLVRTFDHKGTIERREKIDELTGEVVKTTSAGRRVVASVAFSPDGKHVLTGSFDGMRLWDIESGAILRSFAHDEPDPRVLSVAFAPDGSRVLSGGADKTVRLWDTATGNRILTLQGHFGSVNSVAFAPDGGRALSGDEAMLLLLWDLTTGKLASGFNPYRPDAHRAAIMSVAFVPDGKKIVSGSQDQTLQLRDAVSGELVLRIAADQSPVSAVAISPDGTRVLSGHFGDLSKTLRLWDTTTGQLIRVFEGHTGAVRAVAFSPDGTRIVSGSYDNSVKLWDVATGELLRSF
jgi:WD40 repeat protein